MDKYNMQNSINDVFGLKQKAIESLEALSLLTLSAKSALENAKAEATFTAEWADLKNDKTRDAFLRNVCADQYAALDRATEEERAARHKLTLLDLEVERLRMIVKINCEWQQN